MSTRKEIFAWIAAELADAEYTDEAAEMRDEAVAMCCKYIDQLSKPRKKKVNETLLAVAAQVVDFMEPGKEYTNKELVAAINGATVKGEEGYVSSQRMAAVTRHLVNGGTLVKNVPEAAKDPATYTLAEGIE